MTFFSELLVAAFHLQPQRPIPQHMEWKWQALRGASCYSSSCWSDVCFFDTISFPNSLNLSLREHTDPLDDPICRQVAGSTAQRLSETLGRGWNYDGEYELCSGFSRSAIKACWRFTHTLAHLGCVFGLTGRLVLPSDLPLLPPPKMH